jgi:16S rRNA (guanine(1405)-N(7))-methyltransferase
MASVVQKERELIASIKLKKGLSSLDDRFVAEKVKKVFASNRVIQRKFYESKDFAQFSRSKEHEELLKRIRKELRAVYGVFQATGDRERRDILERLRTTKSGNERKRIIDELLSTHTSTKERLPYYDEVYAEICARTKPKFIIDLGCGLNPLAYQYFVQHGFRPTIIASDLSVEDMAFLDECFKVLGIPGKTIALDLTKNYKMVRTLKGDVTLLFKLLDSLEETKRHISYDIFDHITTPWIVASFPTKSLGGRKSIARAGRAWFERLLTRKGLRWETFSVENELFYVIRNR